MLSCLKAITSLMKKLETKLSSFNQKELFTDIEMRLVPILASMETRAINIDASVFFKFSDILKVMCGDAIVCYSSSVFLCIPYNALNMKSRIVHIAFMF